MITVIEDFFSEVLPEVETVLRHWGRGQVDVLIFRWGIDKKSAYFNSYEKGAFKS